MTSRARRAFATAAAWLLVGLGAVMPTAVTSAAQAQAGVSAAAADATAHEPSASATRSTALAEPSALPITTTAATEPPPWVATSSAQSANDATQTDRSPSPSSAQRTNDAAPADPARSLESPVLTLADAVAHALDAAPAVAVARASEAAARAQLADAEADLAPALSLSGSAFRYQKPTIVTPIHGFSPGLFPSFDRTVLLGDLQLRYDLWDGGARAARIEERRQQLAAAEAAANAASGAAASRTIAAYLAVRTLDEQIAAHGERLTALAAERGRVAQLLAVGRAAEVDVLQVRAAQAAAEAERVTLVAERDRVARDLVRQLGDEAPAAPLQSLTAVTLAEPEPPPRGELLARALEHNGEVGRARRELDAAASAVAAARAGRAPSLRAEGNLLGFAGGNGDASGEWNAGVRVAVPLWDRHVAARVALAEAGRDAAAASLRVVSDQVAADLDRAWADFAAARARADSLSEAEARYAEVLRVEKLRLSAGAGVETDYLRAEADLLAARANAAEARNRAAAARAELERIAGELTPEWVARAFVTSVTSEASSAPASSQRGDVP
ncbi:MAG TPA: TolC family protein [Thermoanaerobaculia bacterium]|jgi:outer membrane protein TolC|nr:TolC family protein [Thermoanaerobaculia bacterium]